MAKRGLLLEGLGLVGLGPIEPVVIAAVAAELPILLVGPHGTGKSLLLSRIAEALGLRWRHYNASLLSYDDLAGYPVPDGKGSLDWLRTPATIWDAQAVFLDEINRCRPDLQNKLFPIVHERRLQGIELPDLRHRWAAMNPVGHDDAAADRYRGAEPLDAALADRFPFIVEMPDWRALQRMDQERLLLADLVPVDPAAQATFAEAVAATRSRYEASVASPDRTIAIYVRHAIALLGDAKMALSPRRGAMLVRTIAAVRAVSTLDPDEATLLALRFGLPARATGDRATEGTILAIHKDSLAVSRTTTADLATEIRAIADPLERTRRALATPELEPGFRSAVVADGYAALGPGAREALAVHAIEEDLADGLHGTIAGQLSAAYTRVVTPQGVSASVASGGSRHAAWQAVTRLLSAEPVGPASSMLENLLVASWADGTLVGPDDVTATRDRWTASRAALALAARRSRPRRTYPRRRHGVAA
jgi:MoxR-like ATPase